MLWIYKCINLNLILKIQNPKFHYFTDSSIFIINQERNYNVNSISSSFNCEDKIFVLRTIKNIHFTIHPMCFKACIRTTVNFVHTQTNIHTHTHIYIYQESLELEMRESTSSFKDWRSWESSLSTDALKAIDQTSTKANPELFLGFTEIYVYIYKYFNKKKKTKK